MNTKKKVVKKDEEDILLDAVAKFVDKRGGKIAVIGGIEIQDWGEGEYKFRVAVRCSGRRPIKKADL